MSLSDLAALGSFISGIAVLASLLFVGFQLRQNTQAVRAEASQSHSANWQQIATPIVESAEVARLWRLGLSNMDSLTDDERTRFIVQLTGLFRFYEAARVQWLHGQLNREHWQTVERNVVSLLSQPGVISYWKMRRLWHSDAFQAWIESLPKRTTIGSIYEFPPETQ